MLSDRLLILIAAWIVVNIALFRHLQRFPKYKYKDLERDAPTGLPPERKWYYFIPGPKICVALLFACLFVGFIDYARVNPQITAAIFDFAPQVILWIRGINAPGAILILIPPATDAGPLYIYILYMLFIWVTSLLVWFVMTLLALELMFKFLPDYCLFKFGSSFGRQWIGNKNFRNFSKEQANHLSTGRKWVKVCETISLLALFVIAVNSRSVVGTLLVVALGLYRAWPEWRKSKDEIRRRFDPVKLSVGARKSAWSSTIRASLFLPVILVFIALESPFYIFEQDGVRKYTPDSRSLIPWSNVASAAIKFKEWKPDSNNREGEAPKNPYPGISMTVRLGEESIDLNQSGALSAQKHLLAALIALFQEHAVPISCTMESEAWAQI